MDIDSEKLCKNEFYVFRNTLEVDLTEAAYIPYKSADHKYTQKE
jgi:hypothetical protein